MRSRLILNPASGSNSASDVASTVTDRLRAVTGPLDVVTTAAPGDARRAAAQAARDGFDRVFVGGGDGTLNEALNGLADVPGAFERMAIGLLPLGTGNDFAAALGIPEDLDEALDLAGFGDLVAVDVGWLDRNAFVNVSAGGFIAEVSDATNPALKTISGKLAYLIGGARVLLDYEPFFLRMRLDGPKGRVERDVRAELFAVCNSQLIGGGKLIAPRAQTDDGLLDVCVVEAMPTAQFLALLAAVAKGEHLDDPRVLYFQAAAAEFTFDRQLKVNTDGEVLEVEACRYRVTPGKARFLAGRR